jgi:hypothetical protein
VRESFLLALPCGDDACTDFGGSLAGFVAEDLAEFYLRHFDVQIYPVKQRS